MESENGSTSTTSVFVTRRSYNVNVERRVSPSFEAGLSLFPFLCLEDVEDRKEEVRIFFGESSRASEWELGRGEGTSWKRDFASSSSSSVPPQWYEHKALSPSHCLPISLSYNGSSECRLMQLNYVATQRDERRAG